MTPQRARKPATPKNGRHHGRQHGRRHGRRAVAAAVTVALAAIAGCTTEQSTLEIGSSPTTEATPTSTVPDTTPTTESTDAPTTEPPPTSAPPTTAAPTTLPAGPAAVSLAILAGSGDGGWLNLGSWERTRWERATGPDGPLGIDVEAGTTLTISDLRGARPGTAGTAADACFDDRTGPTISGVPSPEPPGFGYGALAFVPPAWPLRPRRVTTTTATVAAYEALGEAAFDGEPVDASAGDVVQLVIADLDGDGDDEALTVFESPPSGASANPGDLASVLLVDTATRTASTVVRSLIASDAEGGFFVLDRYRVIDVVDLNGDGRMEVAIHAWYFEGAAVLIYEYDGTSLTEVLAAGCGS